MNNPLADRPVHGGYPEAPPIAAPPAADTPRRTWITRDRTTFVYSLPGEQATRAADRQATFALDLQGRGYTLRAARGGWEGATEPATVLDVVGTFPPREIRLVLDALGRAGCRAVQVETHRGFPGDEIAPSGFCAAEWQVRSDPPTCPDCRTADTTTVHGDGSWTCGRCYVDGAPR